MDYFHRNHMTEFTDDSPWHLTTVLLIPDVLAISSLKSHGFSLMRVRICLYQRIWTCNNTCCTGIWKSCSPCRWLRPTSMVPLGSAIVKTIETQSCSWLQRSYNQDSTNLCSKLPSLEAKSCRNRTSPVGKTPKKTSSSTASCSPSCLGFFNNTDASDSMASAWLVGLWGP